MIYIPEILRDTTRAQACRWRLRSQPWSQILTQRLRSRLAKIFACGCAAFEKDFASARFALAPAAFAFPFAKMKKTMVVVVMVGGGGGPLVAMVTMGVAMCGDGGRGPPLQAYM